MAKANCKALRNNARKAMQMKEVVAEIATKIEQKPRLLGED